MRKSADERVYLRDILCSSLENLKWLWEMWRLCECKLFGKDGAREERRQNSGLENMHHACES